jgi:hypothetical protein
MFSQIHYLIRSQADGRYLTAHFPATGDRPETEYLLIFKEHHEALTYLNTHAPDLASRFSVESIPATQLKGILQRWGYPGVGQVQDAIAPRIQFLSYASGEQK